MRSRVPVAALVAALAALPPAVAGQDGGGSDRHPGTAVIRVEDDEYTIPLECRDPTRPELGFTTEPQRITRERTGRSSMVGLRVMPVDDRDELSVWLDRYVTWVPAPASPGGALSLDIDMGPVSILKDNSPVLVTRDMWERGEQPAGLEGVTIRATCGFQDPNAPAYRKIPENGGA